MQKGKEITIYDSASQLNISMATVSRALNDDPVVSKKTRLRVFETAQKMGYRTNHYASNLRKQHTNTIGCPDHFRPFPKKRVPVIFFDLAHVTSSLAGNVYADRFRGYRDALADNNIPFDDAMVMVGDLSVQSGIHAARQMIEMDPRPDGDADLIIWGHP